MAKDGKFGTFGGVFTPSILTILGVIMYMRLPWVVGSAGLYTALGIIFVSHVISVCTGLSISSIATDKKVGAGGPYYIVSRSLGLPIGGTLGLALFTGLAFSVSLYVIGFSESFLSTIGIERTPTAIRICGTITILLITVVTFISTAFAIKTQYLILSLIAVSLFAIFAGSPSTPSAPHLKPTEGSASIAVLFGIFFPAVTGFTAGVNMSGDLRDPKRSIPRGTLAAIFAGMVVYVGLAVYLALRVPAKELIENQDVLLAVSLWSPLVVAGIWGATLSSALGSILGAPRILQALSVDRITPRWFAKGYGKTNEPRNALFLAFAIAEGGILIAELDAIARIVSMVFLTTYGFLNLSCAIESWASPDFRPAFRIPRSVSVVGAITSILVMIQLDLLAMFGAVALMAGLFAYLERKQLALEAGDAWAGIWSSLIRSGLYRLSRETEQRRNWRPNILAFRLGSEPRLKQVTAALVTGNGIATDFDLSADDAPEQPEEDPPIGTFSQRLPVRDPYDTIENVCRYHGFAVLRPNTLLLPWSVQSHEPERFARLVDAASEMQKNVLLFSPGEPRETKRPRIDVWWRPGAGNLGLSLALLRFVTRARGFEGSSVRLLLFSPDSSQNDYLRSTARRMLLDARVDASVRVIDAALGEGSFENRVREESADASLVLLGLPSDPGELDAARQARTTELLESLSDVLLLRATSDFEDVSLLGREAVTSFLPPAMDGEELPELELPESPELARAVSELADVHQRLVMVFHEQCIQRVYARHVDLVRGVQSALIRHLGRYEGQSQLPEHAGAAFLDDCRELLRSFETQQLAEQSAIIAAQIEAFCADSPGRRRLEDQIVVTRPASDFEPHDQDSPYVLRFKRRRRWASKLLRRPLAYPVPVGRLERYYFDLAEREALLPALRQLDKDTHQLALQLGKILASFGRVGTLDLSELRERLEELVARGKERSNRHLWTLLVGARKLAERYSADITRFDVWPLAKRERRLPKERGELAELPELAERWSQNQRHLIERAALGLRLATFHQRLVGIVAQAKAAIELELSGGALNDCRTLHTALLRLLHSVEGNGQDAPPRLEAAVDPKSRFEPKALLDALVRETNEPVAELPDSVQTLTDESIQALAEGRVDLVEILELPVRRLVQFVVEAELVGGIEEALADLPPLEQRAATIAQDVQRLVTFQAAELEAREVAPEHLIAVVKTGIERVQGEIEQLSSALPKLDKTIDDKLQIVLDSTSAWDLTSRSASLEQHIRLRQGKIAVSGARGLVRRGLASAKQAAVDLVYRRSSGVLLAKKLQAESAPAGSVVDRVRAFVRDNTPRPEVIESLPFFYRQLFFGQSAVSDAFWVGREEQLDKVRQAIGELSRGAAGAVVVTGARGSGKSALLQRVVDLLDRPQVYRIHARAGGSVEPSAFEAALAKAARTRGSAHEVLRSLPDGSAIVVDDLELWWERSPKGLAVIDLVAELLERHGRRHAFVLSAGEQALRFIDRFRSLSDQAIALVPCTPMPARALKTVVTLRHGSSGMKFSLGDKAEGDLSELALARLFSGHFDYSGGWVGPALRSWITHVEQVDGEALTVRPPRAERWEVLDELRTEWTALLLQLHLHKQLTRARLRRITGLDDRALDRDLDALRRMGLLLDGRQSVLEINPFVHHIVSERFAARGLVA